RRATTSGRTSLSSAAGTRSKEVRLTRSVWKGPFVDGYLMKKAEKTRASGRNEVIKIYARRSTILPQFVGLTFGVYNGHKFIPVQVNENMVGTTSGRFCPPRPLHDPRPPT